MRYIAPALLGILAVSLLASAAWTADEAPSVTAPGTQKMADEMEKAYPGLASGMLGHARLANLPGGILLRSGDVTITGEELAEAIEDAPPRVREQLRKNALFLLENLATSKVLLTVAREAASKTNTDAARLSDNEVVRAWFQEALAEIKVADAEISAFYDENKSMFGGAGLDTVRGPIQQYLLQRKQQEAAMKLIRELGLKRNIEVAAKWVKEQVPLARDNPVDKARLSGKPSLVDFGQSGCGPCDMMAPILETLKKKYEGKANVLFVHTGEEEILGMRYGIDSIPVQVFFDKDGKEVFRHTGFFPQEEIEKKMAEMGVK